MGHTNGWCTPTLLVQWGQLEVMLRETSGDQQLRLVLGHFDLLGCLLTCSKQASRREHLKRIVQPRSWGKTGIPKMLQDVGRWKWQCLQLLIREVTRPSQLFGTLVPSNEPLANWDESTRGYRGPTVSNAWILVVHPFVWVPQQETRSCSAGW